MLHAEHDQEEEADLERRRDDGREQHQHGDDLLAVSSELLDAPRTVMDAARHGREPEHRHGVRDHVEYGGSERESSR